jgi:hypothetical protein
MNFLQRVLIAFIRVYQMTFARVLVAVFGPSSICRFTPSCSHYAVEAIRVHGAVGGSWLAARRLLRCNPWGPYGDDPVPQREPQKSGICHGS